MMWNGERRESEKERGGGERERERSTIKFAINVTGRLHLVSGPYGC